MLGQQSMPNPQPLQPGNGNIAIQRVDRFVARTTNWLYDHLRSLVGYRPIVICDQLQNRDEYPALEAWSHNPESLARKLWRRFASKSILPTDLWRLRKLRPSILHSHFGYVAREDAKLSQSLKVPWVVSFYGADLYQAPAACENLYAGLFAQADAVLALGPAMKQRLGQTGCPLEKVVVHPLGIPVDSIPFRPRDYRRGETLKVLFAGTFREKKGIEYLLDAAALVRRNGVRIELHLVGDATGKPGDLETKKAVFEKIDRLGLEGVTTHHSYVPFRELISLALGCHVFVAPSVTATDGDSEGTPFVLQQMMATGMPVISTTHSDIPFIMGEYSNLLVAERDSTSIAESLQSYADNPDLIAVHGSAMRKRICDAFDVAQCAAKLRAIYDSLQGRPGIDERDP